MLHIYYEGTPVGDIPVQPFNASAPIYWEAGAIGALDANGYGVVCSTASGATVPFGLLADRRSAFPGIAIANFLPAVPANDAYNPGYGDESLFNQPGHGNALFGSYTGANGVTIDNVIPPNTIPTTTNLRDETNVNPNIDTRFVTMYIRGGVYATDQFDPAQTYVAGATVCVDTASTAAGRLTVSGSGTAGAPVGIVEAAPANQGYGFLKFKLTLV